MKKNLFYAAFAIAMMASCTNEDNLVVDPVEPTPEDKVAIELGIDAPTVNATLNPRSTGSVGGTGETGNASEANSWKGQKLYITMIDKDTKAVAEEEGEVVLDWDTYQYSAPASGDKGLIQIKGEQSTNNVMTKNVYYPTQGTYDFYGWHVDDLEAEPDATNPLLIKDITITGSQDIMGARTKEFTEANYGQSAGFTGADFLQMTGWDFSARTARNGIKPILQFEHQLARLKFFVRAGSDKTIKSAGWQTQEDKEGNNVESDAMHVTAITVKKMYNDLEMNLNDNGAITTSTTTPIEEIVDFSLLSRGDDGNMKSQLDPVAPTAKYDANDDATKGVQVGESVMFFPYGDSKTAIELSIDLEQYVRIWGEEGDAFNADYWDYKEQTANLKVHASSVKLPGSTVTEFEAGKSYNVYITIYGFEKIEVSAELTAWEMGGDVDVDVEEEQSKHKVEVSFAVQDKEGNTINNAQITVKKHTKGCSNEEAIAANEAGNYEVESYSVLHYEVVAQGYETATGVVNAQNGRQDVAIILKAQETQTPQNVTSTFVINEGAITDANIAWSYNEGQTTGTGYTVEAPEGTVVSYTITKDAYEAKTGTFTVSASIPNIEVTLDAEQPQVTTVEFTFAINDNADPAQPIEGATILVWKGEGQYEEGTSETVSVTDNKCTLNIGEKYSYKVSKENYQDATGIIDVTSSDVVSTTVVLATN